MSGALFLGNVSLCASEHLPLLCDCHWDREALIWKQESWEFYAVKSSFRPFSSLAKLSFLSSYTYRYAEKPALVKRFTFRSLVE